MKSLCNLFSKQLLRPSESPRGPDVPLPFREREIGFKDHHVLRPADFHRLPHGIGGVFIHTVKVPHAAHIARGESICIGISALQMLRHGHSSAFLRLSTDQAADFPVQFHLRHLGAHGAVNGCEQFAVVDCFSDVHVLFPP